MCIRDRLILFILWFFSCEKANNNHQKITKEVNIPFLPNKTSDSEKRVPLLVSSDFGKTWESASGNLPQDLQASFILQKGSELVLASDNMGVFLSDENKSTWTAMGDKLPNPKINALEVFEENIYAG